MKVIYYTKRNIEPKKDAKHVINFFGILGCIKVNVLGKGIPKEQKLVQHYFDYPYFSRIVNPEFFKKELNDEEKKFTKKIVLCLCFAILSAASAALLYLMYKNQKKMPIGLVFTSVVLSILAAIFFAIVFLWVFFSLIKDRFVAHKVKSFLKNEASPEWIKHCKKELIGETCDQELEKDTDDIVKFLLERKKVVALYEFLTNGEKLVQAGMAMVNMLLEKGIHPNDIILDTNSLGGGVAAEVLKRFEDQGIYLTLIHNNSYSSLKDATNNFPHGIGDFFKRQLPAKFLNFWFRRCELEFNPQEIVKNTKCPVLIVGRKGDTVIPPEAQLVGKLSDQSTGTGQLRKTLMLEHDTEVACENKNIHTDHKRHLVYRENNGSMIKYKEKEIQFIEEAHEYLIDNGLNKEFYQEQYTRSSFSRNLQEVELIYMKPVHVQNSNCVIDI